jgi:phosphoribosylanthranilate isomerase
MLKIKVCGIADPSNAASIAELQVDFMGFIFFRGSQRYVGINPDESLFSDLPSGILKTGVFVDANPGLVIEYSERYKLDLIQLHGNETSEYCRFLMKKDIKIIKAFKVSEGFDFSTGDEYLDVCDFFLFDADKAPGGGSGIKFDWNMLNSYKSGKPFFLSGGIKPDDADTLSRLKHPDLFAVDINSQFEIYPGFKDVSKVETFIKDIKG